MACHTNVVWHPQLTRHSIWSFLLGIAVPPSGYFKLMVKSQCLPLCQTLQKLKNVGQPNPLAHDNKAKTILSFPL